MGLYEIGNSRSEEQRQEMLRLDQQGICLFCRLGETSGEEGSVLKETQWWMVIRNQFPYRGTKLHLLLVPKRHASDLVDLPRYVQAEMWSPLEWARREFRLQYYGLAVRCGDCRFTGGTIEHVHIHLLVGDVDDPLHEPVRFKLSSQALRRTV